MNRSLARLTHRRLLSTQATDATAAAAAAAAAATGATGVATAATGATATATAGTTVPPDQLTTFLAERKFTEPTPKSVFRIPTKRQPVGDASVVIRDIGCSRRVFLLDHALNSEVLEGLAHRIKLLTKNIGINSVLIANDDTDDRASNCKPAMLNFEQTDDLLAEIMGIRDFHYKQKYVSQGYDPLHVFTSGMYQDIASLQELLDGLTKLALACQGASEGVKVPVVTIPHGRITDGGYAICLASYVMTTDETSFSILNPSRGLTLDPIGLSHILPRLGWDFRQHSAKFPGCGIILACSGIEINCHDMVYTGLATNYMGSIRRLGPLERSLSDALPWNQQTLFKPARLIHGQQPVSVDYNEVVRNKQIGNVIESVTTYSVFNAILDVKKPPSNDDPTTNLDFTPLFGMDQPTPLIDRAIVFSNIFIEENTIHGIVERFREEASRIPSDDFPRPNIEAAAMMVEGFDRQSPLALSVTYELLQSGGRSGQTLQSCMERETCAQMNMYGKADFQAWAQHAVSNGPGVPFHGWTHKNLSEVSQDEVKEITNVSPTKLSPFVK